MISRSEARYSTLYCHLLPPQLFGQVTASNPLPSSPLYCSIFPSLSRSWPCRIAVCTTFIPANSFNTLTVVFSSSFVTIVVFNFVEGLPPPLVIIRCRNTRCIYFLLAACTIYGHFCPCCSCNYPRTLCSCPSCPLTKCTKVQTNPLGQYLNLQESQ